MIIFNKPKDIEIILLYNDNKEYKDIIINELNNKYNILKNDINNLKSQINILKKDIEILNIQNKKIKDKLISKNSENNINMKQDMYKAFEKNKRKKETKFYPVKENTNIKNSDINININELKKKYSKEILLYNKFQCEKNHIIDNIFVIIILLYIFL